MGAKGKQFVRAQTCPAFSERSVASIPPPRILPPASSAMVSPLDMPRA